VKVLQPTTRGEFVYAIQYCKFYFENNIFDVGQLYIDMSNHKHRAGVRYQCSDFSPYLINSVISFCGYVIVIINGYTFCELCVSEYIVFQFCTNINITEAR